MRVTRINAPYPADGEATIGEMLAQYANSRHNRRNLRSFLLVYHHLCILPAGNRAAKEKESHKTEPEGPEHERIEDNTGPPYQSHSAGDLQASNPSQRKPT